MKNYLICAGGSGVRALESMLHLCASGVGPEEIKVLVIDPDASNGNYTRTNDLMTDYRDCCEAYRAKLGKEHFFATKVTALAGGNGGGLQVWSPVDSTQSFSKVLGFDLLRPEHKDVARLLFTNSEMDMKLNVGFKGHPSLGAAALSLLPLYGVRDDPKADPVWLRVGAQLSNDLAVGPVRVMIVGSVFGGTGASVFYPLARRLRELAGARVENLTIGVVALAPYFTFPISADAPADGPDARKFPIATQAAAQFYQHLRQTDTGQATAAPLNRRAWQFDAMFWLGDDKPADVAYGAGGEHQKNSAHFVELLAGLTCLDYFSRSATAAGLGGACYFAGPEGDDKENVTTWKDLPLLALNRDDIRRKVLRFALAGAMHAGFFTTLLDDAQSDLFKYPTAIPWYCERFKKLDDRDDRLNVPPHNAALAALSRFLSLRHFPWWREVHTSAGGRVQLLNVQSILFQEGTGTASLDLGRLANILFPDRGLPNPNSVHNFFNQTCEQQKLGPGETAAVDGAPAYLATLANAAGEFARREYPDV